MNNETPDPANKEDGEADSPPPRQAIQAAKSFASESVFSQAMAPGEALKPQVPEGFLGGSYFYLQGFSSKQVSTDTRYLIRW
jgi:DNA replication regulator DPB11